MNLTMARAIVPVPTEPVGYTDGTDILVVPEPAFTPHNDSVLIVHADGSVTEEYAGDGAFEAWEEVRDTLTAAAPTQARAPRGTEIGGQWIDTPHSLMLDAIAQQGQVAAMRYLREHPEDREAMMEAVRREGRRRIEAEAEPLTEEERDALDAEMRAEREAADEVERQAAIADQAKRDALAELPYGDKTPAQRDDEDTSEMLQDSLAEPLAKHGLSARQAITSDDGEGNTVVELTLIDNASGAPVGTVSRGFNADGTVENLYMSIKPEFQGKGIGSDFTTAMEDQWAAQGYTNVKVKANIDVGGYAWARLGFEFETPGYTAPYIIDRIAAYVPGWDPYAPDDWEQKNPHAPTSEFFQEWEDFADLKRRVSVGDYPTAAELASFGWSEGADIWPGKQGMLGSGWAGVKPLTEPVLAAMTPGEKLWAIGQLHRQWVATARYDSIPVDGPSQYPELEEDIHTHPDSDAEYMTALRAILRDDPAGLTAAAGPSQARAPKGTPIGGEWIETPGGLADRLTGGGAGRASAPAGVQDVVREQGGASIDPLTGLQPTDGYQVGLKGYTKIVPQDEFFGPDGADSLVSWIDEHQEQLSQPGGHIGLWHDTETGNVVFDVSMNVKDRDEAIRLGQEGDQVSIWDNVAGDEIQTGGTGEGLRSSGDPQADTHRMEDYGRDTGPASVRGAPPGLGGVGRGAQARLRAGDDRRPGPRGLSFGAPGQARAPKGVVIGGQWIDTPGGLLNGINYTGPMTLPEGVELDPILVDMGWTMDPDTREVIMPPKDPNPPVEHFDPTTVYGQPGAPSSYEQLAGELAETNPSYNDPTGGGKMNCQRTSAAFEMQARGYDVVAPPAPGIDGKASNIESMWRDSEGRTPMFTLLPRPTTQDAIQSTDWAPGYRFIVIGHNADLGSGHAWNAEVMEDGSIFQWDPQSGDEMHPSFWGLDKINVLRVDNLEPTSTIAYDGGRRMPPWAMSRQEYEWAYPPAGRS